MNVREGSDSWGDDGSAPTRSDDTPFLPRVLFSLRRRAFLIVLVWAVTMAAAALVVSLQPPQFRAEATLEVRPEQPLITDPSDPTIAGSLTLWDSYFRTQASLLQSRRLLERVLRSVPPPVAKDYRAADDPVQALANQLEVESIPSTFIVRVALIHPSPERGPEIVNALVSAYQEEATGPWRQIKTGAVELLDRETLPALQRKLRRRTAISRSLQGGDGASWTSRSSMRRSGTDGGSSPRSCRRSASRGPLPVERDALREINSENLVGLFDPALAGTRALEPLLTLRSTLEASIASESLVYKDKHPRMMSLRRQLQEVKAQLQGVVQAATKSLDREILAAVIEEQTLLRDQAVVEKEMADSRVRLTRYKRLEVELASARDVGNATVKKADDARRRRGAARQRPSSDRQSPAGSSGKGRSSSPSRR
jgi:uncharacterized protein involved in exopolysaccharide biosynthesis